MKDRQSSAARPEHSLRATRARARALSLSLQSLYPITHLGGSVETVPLDLVHAQMKLLVGEDVGHFCEERRDEGEGRVGRRVHYLDIVGALNRHVWIPEV